MAAYRSAPLRAIVIWTIGHSSRSWEEFLALLQAQSIEALVDVRRFAGSRRYPQFGPDRLPPALAAAGISYLPIAELGGRRKASAASSNTIWRNLAFRAYADHMQTEEYLRGRERLLQRATEQRTVIMCSEAVWWRCHRALIADDLKAMGLRVLHIVSGRSVVEHPFTTAARIRNGRLFYGPADSSQEIL